MSEASLKIPGSFEERKGAQGPKATVPFLLIRFLWASKENE